LATCETHLEEEQPGDDEGCPYGDGQDAARVEAPLVLHDDTEHV
jgi:hypothetical protein